jgi:hypothetical protein
MKSFSEFLEGTNAYLRKTEMNDHLTRYQLPNGWFIDNDRIQSARSYGYAFELFAPGERHAGFTQSAKTLKDALVVCFKQSVVYSAYSAPA